MKYLLVISVFLIGGLIGFFVGKNSTVIIEKRNKITEAQVITEVVYDTIIKKEVIEVPVPVIIVDSLSLDTIPIESVDTTEVTDQIEIKDTSEIDSDIVIRRERMIKSKKYQIIFLTEEIKKDTALKEMLGIKESKITELIVEFWESPLNFSGYKLSKNKLILYGLSDQFKYQIYKRNKVYYIGFEDILYGLKETQEFLPFVEVDRENILND
ncbi:hypothetical protein [Crocinitomix catalasitica]|uniref:hypothetical protein n=1 Tax=Crocinitomix catalasitica TaxID=184607 RepID=UPI0004894187|nr:hypothetical protein [Crocinitomix catalasitica]